MRRWSLSIAAVALAIGVSSGATGLPAGPEVGRLTQLRGAAGCLASKPVPGCGRIVGVRDVRFFKRAVTSPDGRSVYVAGGFGSLLALRRNTATGALTQPRGSAACATWDHTPPCLRMPPSEAFLILDALALAPDGKSLYVGSEYFDYSGGKNEERTRFDVLARKPRDGTLRRVPTVGACFVSSRWLGAPQRCTVSHTMLFPNSILVSPDGRHVYVASSGGISVFRNSHGELAQLPGEAGCLLAPAGPQTPGEPDRCSDRPRRTGPTMSLVSSPDGRDVYALLAGDQRKEWDSSVLLSLRRDGRTGAVKRAQGPTGCLSGSPRAGCRVVKGLAGPNRFWGTQLIAGSPDGQSLYFANKRGILTLARTADGTLAARSVVTRFPYAQAGVSDMVVSGDGRTLYVAASDSLIGYTRDTRTGQLSRFQCLARAPRSNCQRAPSFSQTVDAVTIAPDGRNVYVVGTTGDATRITTFGRSTTG